MNEEYVIIKTVIESLLNKMGIEGLVEFADNSDFQQFTVKTGDTNVLIGEDGQNLVALNIVLRKIISKKLNTRFLPPFTLDVNGYHEKKINILQNLAKTSAQEAKNLKKEIILNPMNAYERRIIHTALGGYPDIKTESVGEGYNRKVIIKPV